VGTVTAREEREAKRSLCSRSHDDSWGTTDDGGHDLTERAYEHLPAHNALWSTPLHAAPRPVRRNLHSIVNRPLSSDSTHPHPVHTHVHATPCTPTPTVSPVSQTPIYDQLRGEHINVDVPAPEVGPEQVDHTRGDLVPADARDAAEMFARPPGPWTNLTANHHVRDDTPRPHPSLPQRPHTAGSMLASTPWDEARARIPRSHRSRC
jgi:hypothetical protein